MKTEEIIAGNVLLAEFMGFKQRENNTIQTTKQFGIGTICADDLRFHYSWDWLMPVVEKIESLEYDVEIGSQYIRIDGGLDDGFGIDSWNSGSKIESVFTVCIEFAKWYKNQAK